ncbi:TetR/AcrR family transcriptional regulator [Gordonia sp. PDNC005]|jgi:AcrR family transcriptional regulator|uniref:TetR/AcrR family transcriptional regulator n=1 Tax=unclassified Gordonia (in: high G+C Gram-positive bacteria) TaxID=2657482 RepID=UPI00196486F5|nr:TetR/AcrR family transcriptional regulator [Gordonia sp. PDNC005]QRY61945.1 TetR/AcrR family transcriptional regulator [Gordonia sp. PDNC005]
MGDGGMSVPVRRTQEERSAQTRAALMEATIDCLVEFGYSGITTTRVAERAGVTRGAQMHHFGSRNELVSHAIRHLAERRSAEAVERVGRIAESLDPLDSLFDLLWDLHDGPLFVASVELWVAARTDADLRVDVVEFEALVDKTIGEAVAAHVPSELARPMLDFAYTAMDALRGLLVSGFLTPGSDRPLRRWQRAKEVLRAAADPRLLDWAASARA